MRREPTEGREREYQWRPMITAAQAGWSSSLPHFPPGVREGGSALVELVTEISLLVLLVGAEEQREAEGCEELRSEVCEQREQS
jgi:hypothetical protein